MSKSVNGRVKRSKCILDNHKKQESQANRKAENTKNQAESGGKDQ